MGDYKEERTLELKGETYGDKDLQKNPNTLKLTVSDDDMASIDTNYRFNLGTPEEALKALEGMAEFIKKSIGW